jgi:hypothetical protein
MTPTEPSIPVAAEPTAVESYPTFWDAIPVDAAGESPQPRTPTVEQDEAYAAFLAHAENPTAVTLTVEQSDVGLN